MRSLPLVGPPYPSASALGGAAVCVAPWSLGLPREDTAGADAERGRVLHGGSEALARTEAYLPQTAAVKAVALSHGTWRDVDEVERVLTHVAFTLEGDRAVVMKRDAGGVWYVEQGVQWRPGDMGDEARLVERAPGEEVPGWFSGTADLAYVRADGVLVVADWKFGPRQRWTAERAENHWQGWSLALYLCTALGISAARAGDVVARFEARYVDDEGVWTDGVDITQGELDGHAVALGMSRPDAKAGLPLGGLAYRIESGEGPRIGPACGSCKAKASCPAYAAIGHEAAAALVPSSTSDLWRPPRTEDDARLLHYRIGAVETWLGRAKEYRRSFVLTHDPIPLGNGQELAAIGRKTRSLLGTPEALAAIEEVVPGAVTVETKKTATIASVKDAARAAAGDGITSTADRNRAKRAAEERVMGELSARGVLVEAGTVYALGVRRSDGTVEVVDRIGEEDE